MSSVRLRGLGVPALLMLTAASAVAQPVLESARSAAWTWAARPLPAPLVPDTLDAPPDRWLGRDKAYHAGGSFLLTLAAQGVLTAGGAASADALPVAAGTALALGVMKEAADARRPRHPLFSLRDLAADGLGVLAAVALVAALSRADG